MAIVFDGKTIFENNRHGWPSEMPPQAHVMPNYFWGSGRELHLMGGSGARMVLVHGTLGNQSHTSLALWSNGLKDLHDLIGKRVTTTNLVASVGNTIRTWQDVYLAGIEPIPHPGQTLPVPILDVVGGTTGPAAGGYWLQATLHFVQVRKG